MSGPAVYHFENKILKKRKIDSLVTLTVSRNIISNKIFVEFITKDGKLKLQRNFDNTLTGVEEARKFETKITSVEDLYKYFGIKKEKDNYVIRKTRRKNKASKANS